MNPHPAPPEPSGGASAVQLLHTGVRARGANCNAAPPEKCSVGGCSNPRQWRFLCADHVAEYSAAQADKEAAALAAKGAP